jgi:phosphoribosylformylglycinamidine cyclo-ligase
MKRMTYSDAGVNLDEEHKAEQALITQIAHVARKEFGAPLESIGHYAGLIDFGDKALALCTDGVGSKVLVANQIRKWDTIGIDCIAMNVNDMICVGAEPLALVDYLAIEKSDAHITEEIGKGLAEGARQSNITILGGETAIMPGIIIGFDLAGTALGFVKKENIVTGDAITVGDVIIGIKSSGLHSNGFSLAREIIKKSGKSYLDRMGGTDRPIGELLITPTKIYVREILALLENFRGAVHGLANITGGGMTKLTRLKKDVQFVIDEVITPQPIFTWLQGIGNVDDAEMYRTFNMGIGFCVIVDKESADDALAFIKKDNEAQIIGHVADGKGVSLTQFDVNY